MLEATGLPSTLSPYVECQFTFLNQESVVIPPELTPDQVSPKRRYIQAIQKLFVNIAVYLHSLDTLAHVYLKES